MNWGGRGMRVAALHTSRALCAEPPLLKRNYKQDIVYLYQFPHSKFAPNLSPFCLKLESYLRIKNIKYEVCETFTKRSKNGLLPFIELNGQHHADSGQIIEHLEKRFNCQDSLTAEEHGVARALNRMLDGSTLHAIQLDRVVKNGPRFLSREVSAMPLPGFITSYLGNRMAKEVSKRMRKGLGKLTDAEVKEVLRRDLQAIDSLIGQKRFLFGDTPTATDCSVFGHIASCLFLPYRQALSDMVEDDFHSLQGLIKRFRAHYYPEWKD